MIYDKHANLKYKYGNRHFWAEGYYVSTVGLNEATIKKYIKEQVAANKLVVIAVEIGRNCNHALMQELTGLRDDRHVLRADNAKSLVDFFKFSSSMLVSCSKFKNACEELNETDLRDYKNFAEQ